MFFVFSRRNKSHEPLIRRKLVFHISCARNSTAHAPSKSITSPVTNLLFYFDFTSPVFCRSLACKIMVCCSWWVLPHLNKIQPIFLYNNVNTDKRTSAKQIWQNCSLVTNQIFFEIIIISQFFWGELGYSHCPHTLLGVHWNTNINNETVSTVLW